MPHEATTRVVQLDLIRIDGGTQIREAIDLATVDRYAEDMRNGDDFEPVVLFDDGAARWLADGFHRYHAARKAGLEGLNAEVRPGTLRDAILFACGANTKGLLHRKNADKRKAVLTLLQDKEWGARSDVWIAESSGTGRTFVANVRREIQHATVAGSEPAKRLGRDGKERRMPERKPTPPDEPEILDGDTCDEDGTDEVEDEPKPKSRLGDRKQDELRKEATTGAATLDASEKGGRVVPRVGMQFAQLAVMKLEQIHPKDAERKQAFDYVRGWLNEQES